MSLSLYYDQVPHIPVIAAAAMTEASIVEEHIVDSQEAVS
jgi:hypothetical protein